MKPEHDPSRGPRTLLDLRPVALSRWENEGGAVPDRAQPLRDPSPTPLHRGVLLTSA
jgi:hypothetical protein